MLDILIKGYYNPSLLTKLLNENKESIGNFPNLSYIALLYNNTNDIVYFTELCGKTIYNDVSKINLEKHINLSIFLNRQGCSNEFIEKYLKYSFDNIDIDAIFNHTNKFNYVSNPFIDNLRNENLSKFNKIMEHIDFFNKKDIVKWLPTNNRKTKEFFADYGPETNDLIKFIHNRAFIDKEYQKSIKLLGINSFKESIDTSNMFALRAMLSSIIMRERFGVGNISRAIADGLISAILNRMNEIISINSL